MYSGHKGFIAIHPDQIAQDFVSLRQLSKQYSLFSKETRIVGPDVVGADDIIRRYEDTHSQNLL